ncbi:GNAT family N-acetyltransferase [Vibrio sp. 10N.261.51.F11]|uniref:GNAT family N-acetyltransferase n=1 Tax=Vibrio sp. 10N.261.51.F11 TaxID=3229678 RepID=UPI003552CAA8
MNEEIVYKLIENNAGEINATVKLLELCFPGSNKFSYEYLKWLYFCNPVGDAIGYNAYCNGELIGHYSCIPLQAYVSGEKSNGLLSLNTATDPAFQGRGLFKKLANKTYNSAKDLNYKFVCGVANSRSTRLFTKLLRFDLVGPLDVKIGFGDYFKNITKSKLETSCMFFPTWSEQALDWRMSNPHNISKLVSKSDSITRFVAPTQYGFIDNLGCCYSDCSVRKLESERKLSDLVRLKMILALCPDDASSTYISLPERLKPSPLNFIYKNLFENDISISSNNVFFNYMDFDAY